MAARQPTTRAPATTRLNIRRDALEAFILNGLRKHLMDPALFKEFCTEFTKEVNRLRIERGADLEGWKREPERIDKELDKIVDAIVQGFPLSKLKDKSEKLEARKAELTEKLANADEPPPLLHPIRPANLPFGSVFEGAVPQPPPCCPNGG
ncbi:hypothetical protein AB9K34_17450 [Sedimentitalea sp. XS_ASV28]|uniref:hypothetical protein n=1 Tax=Sedimentitalea sp. XS_ASV28 TaxID=3241296 RepID=UPI00351235C5